MEADRKKVVLESMNDCSVTLLFPAKSRSGVVKEIQAILCAAYEDRIRKEAFRTFEER